MLRMREGKAQKKKELLTDCTQILQWKKENFIKDCKMVWSIEGEIKQEKKEEEKERRKEEGIVKEI